MSSKRLLMVDEIANMFGEGVQRGVWLRDSIMSVYVRISPHRHTVDDQPIIFIEVANICVRQPKLRSKGHFTVFLAKLEAMGPVYIENVLEDRFANFFCRRNYVEVKRLGTPCFYLLPKT